MRTRKCKCCGEVFEITGRTVGKKYCSAACRIRYNWLKRKLRREAPVSYCRMCGKVDAQGGTVCAECRKLAEPMVQQGYKLEELRRQVCSVCGVSFVYVARTDGKGGTRTVCDQCASDTKPQKFYESKRQCHDCGRPTNNYRCPRCLSKWRIKHGVAANPADDGDDVYI